MTTRLTLVCHGSTSAVRMAAFPADEPLDCYGRRGLKELATELGGAARCWMGPSLRTRETAEELQFGGAVDARLDECDYGRWAGQAFSEVQAREPEGLVEWLRDPDAAPHGGESVRSLLARVAGWLDEQRGSTGRVVAVTHASVIRAAVVHAIEATPTTFWRIDVAPISITRLSASGPHWTLVALGSMARRQP